MNLKLIVLLITGLILISACSTQQVLTTQNPYSQASVVIHQKSGETKEGIVLKREGDNLVYIDSKTHKKETMPYKDIQKLTESNVLYDFEANPIPGNLINEEKGIGNTLLYGGGGLILGAAAGTGLGIALVGAGVDAPVLISTAVFGAAGAWYFGSKGSDNDYEDAVFEIRKKRYAISRQKREKEIAEEKEKLLEQKKEKEKLLEQLKKKKDK